MGRFGYLPKWGVGEHPVHEGAQLEQEGHEQEGLEEHEVEVAVAFGDEVAEDALGKAAADLARGEAEVEALDEVVEFGGQVLGEGEVGCVGQDEEEPEVDDEDEQDLEEEFAVDVFAEVEGAVEDHEHELDEEEVEELFGHFVLFQRAEGVGLAVDTARALFAKLNRII